MIAARTVVTSDGIKLEVEVAQPSEGLRAGMALCHPHPQFGGSMRSIVISTLFEALPRAGIMCLRFNFRGVEGSDGVHDEGRAEPLDVAAAVDALATELPAGVPLVLTGWSFGADMALATVDDRITAWLAIAPPLRFAADYPASRDPRRKLLVLAQHDEFRSPESVIEAAASWRATNIETVRGASHFFVGRTDRLVELAHDYIDELVASA